MRAIATRDEIPDLYRVENNFTEKVSRRAAFEDMGLGSPGGNKSPASYSGAFTPGSDKRENSDGQSAFDSEASRKNFWKEISKPAPGDGLFD